jgi:hypothetical protein
VQDDIAKAVVTALKGRLDAEASALDLRGTALARGAQPCYRWQHEIRSHMVMFVDLSEFKFFNDAWSRRGGIVLQQTEAESATLPT